MKAAGAAQGRKDVQHRVLGGHDAYGGRWKGRRGREGVAGTRVLTLTERGAGGLGKVMFSLGRKDCQGDRRGGSGGAGHGEKAAPAVDPGGKRGTRGQRGPPQP